MNQGHLLLILLTVDDPWRQDKLGQAHRRVLTPEELDNIAEGA